MVIIVENSVITITSHVTLFDVNGQDNSDTLVSTVVPSVDDLYKAACTPGGNRPKLAYFLIGRWFFGSLVFRSICKSAEKSVEIEFGSDQKSAENLLKQPIRTVHKF